jgi:hypothetical protein
MKIRWKKRKLENNTATVNCLYMQPIYAWVCVVVVEF